MGDSNELTLEKYYKDGGEYFSGLEKLGKKDSEEKWFLFDFSNKVSDLNDGKAKLDNEINTITQEAFKAQRIQEVNEQEKVLQTFIDDPTTYEEGEGEDVCVCAKVENLMDAAANKVGELNKAGKLDKLAAAARKKAIYTFLHKELFRKKRADLGLNTTSPTKKILNLSKRYPKHLTTIIEANDTTYNQRRRLCWKKMGDEKKKCLTKTQQKFLQEWKKGDERRKSSEVIMRNNQIGFERSRCEKITNMEYTPLSDGQSATEDSEYKFGICEKKEDVGGRKKKRKSRRRKTKKRRKTKRKPRRRKSRNTKRRRRRRKSRR